MALVTVPCRSCSKPIGLLDEQCRGCRAPVPPDLRTALDERLESASEEYRDYKKYVRQGMVTYLVVGGLWIVLGLFLYAAMGDDLIIDGPQEKASRLTDLLVNLTAGGALIGCAAWSRRAPVPALATGLALWIATRFFVIDVVALLASQFAIGTIVRQLMSQIVVSVILIRALWNALQARRLVTRLATPPSL